MNERDAFSSCFVDGDPEVLTRGRRLRIKALAISLVLEAVLIAVMLIWPLITPAALPRPYVVIPTQPYGGRATENAANRPSSKPHRGHGIAISALRQPPVIPSRVFDSMNEQTLDPMLGSNLAVGQGSGPDPDLPSIGVPGGTGIDMSPVAPPKPSPAPSAPVKRSKGVMEAQLIDRVQPIYPKLAADIHLSGSVELRAIIGLDGHVRQLEVLSGNPILARAARDAVNQWIYRPTLLNGSAVEVETLITVKFVLE